MTRSSQIVTSVLACLAVAACAAMPDRDEPITELLVFADTSEVRLEIGLEETQSPDRLRLDAEIRAKEGGGVLWSGPLELGAGESRLSANISGLSPQLWTPTHPHLYQLIVEVRTAEGSFVGRKTVRFGFRSVEAQDGRILLNGEPIFLRGNAINPPNRTIPEDLAENREFVENYIRHQKSIGVNIIRMHHHSQVWFDVCDELGMMVFQGRYGTPKGGSSTNPPDISLDEAVAYYKEDVLKPLVNHPSVIIYVLSNEQASEDIPYLNRGAAEVERFLTSVYDELVQWDDNRLYIGNAGYGLGRSGDIADVHRYWGWYYNSFLSFYTLRNPENYWRTNKIQPITLSENTGNYTGPDGRYNLVPRSKQPDSQLNWTGHAPEEEQSNRALSHQAFVAKQAIEITRRIRSENPHVSGLMPFTILYSRWHDIDEFHDMGPKPVADQFSVSYSPVLLSWELWKPNVYAGTTLRPVAHVVNDSDARRRLDDLTLRFALKGAVDVEAEPAPLPAVEYYEARFFPLSLELPARLPEGTYTLEGELLSGGSVLARNETNVYVAPNSSAEALPSDARSVALYDPAGRTRRAFAGAGISFENVSNIDGLRPVDQILVIGAESWDDYLARSKERLASFVAAGGRIILLRQSPDRFDPSWLPGGVRLQTAPLDHALVYPGGRPFRNGLAVNPERSNHPVFRGISRDRLYMWSDWTDWNQTQRGFPAIYPITQGFVFSEKDALGRTAVLANYDHGLQGIGLAELFAGNGSVLLSGFNLVDRHGLDPIADRMMRNMVTYMASADPHHPHPLIDSKIVWGDYGSERGLVTGIQSGFILNSVPVVPEGLQEKYPLRIDENGFQFAGARGGWNSRPSIQYVAKGRRAFGPYYFSTGGAARLPEGHGSEGEGRFWLRVLPDRTSMVTTVWNPVDVPLTVRIEVNGVTHERRIPSTDTIAVETPLRRSDRALAVRYRGDRRLVFLETDFRSD